MQRIGPTVPIAHTGLIAATVPIVQEAIAATAPILQEATAVTVPIPPAAIVPIHPEAILLEAAN